jgi:hypothetical protein
MCGCIHGRESDYVDSHLLQSFDACIIWFPGIKIAIGQLHRQSNIECHLTLGLLESSKWVFDSKRALEMYNAHCHTHLRTWIYTRICCVTSSFRCDADEICALLGYTQRRVVILYRRFGTTHRSLLQGSRSPRLLVFLDSWRWNRSVVPKRRYSITTLRCVIYQKSADLMQVSFSYSRQEGKYGDYK